MYQPPRKPAHGDIITAEMWNTLTETADAHIRERIIVATGHSPDGQVPHSRPD